MEIVYRLSYYRRLFLISNNPEEFIHYTLNEIVTKESQNGRAKMQWILIDVPLGRNIQTIRIEKNMTQEEVATKLQLMGSTMSRSTLANIETGRRNIKANDLKLLKIIFNVDIDVFNSGTDLKSEIASGIKYDLIFLDIYMKDENAIIVFVSRHDECMIKLFRLGVFAFIKKPIQINILKKVFLEAIIKILSQISEERKKNLNKKYTLFLNREV